MPKKTKEEEDEILEFDPDDPEHLEEFLESDERIDLDETVADELEDDGRGDPIEFDSDQ